MTSGALVATMESAAAEVIAVDGCDRGVDAANHDDADCDGDAGTAADAAGIAVVIGADDAHPASHHGHPNTNEAANQDQLPIMIGRP